MISRKDDPRSRIQPGPGSPPGRLRIALYSHDTQGLGHVRRSLLIAKALSRRAESPVILMLSGVHEAAAFEMPDGVDCLTLPSLAKDTLGGYAPRSLGVPMDELMRIRSGTISAALRSFKPHLLVVDKVPLGALEELRPGLEWLNARGQTRVVLGLREILDDPETVSREWSAGRYDAAIRACYDRIWVYGDRDVYDPVAEYAFSADIAARVRYTGYLDPFDRSLAADASEDVNLPADRRVVLCAVGGGRDGLPLADAFMGSRLPADALGLLITGPLMPAESRERLRALASARGDMKVLDFVSDPSPYLRRADRIIAMGGYNTMCEIASLGKPALIVPRTQPRLEQRIRAERFADRGIVDMVLPEDLGAGAITNWLHGEPAVRHPGRGVIDMGGVTRLPDLVDEALAGPRSGWEPRHATG